MREIYLLAINDLRLTLRDRTVLIWMLLLPVALMWFFGQVGGGPTGPPPISLTFVNHDGGWLSRALLEELEDERVNMQDLAPPSAETGEPVEAKEIHKVRTLIIPEGFTRGVLAGEQQVLRLEKEPDSDEAFGVAAQVHIVRAIVRTLPRLVEMGAGRNGTSLPGGDDEQLEAFRDLGDRPALVSLEVSNAGMGRPVPGGLAQSVPGILTMNVLLMTLIYGGVFLTTERKGGMLRRQATLPLRRAQLFAGKMAGRLLMAGVQIVLLVATGRFLLGISWGDSPVGLALLLMSYAIAVGSLATLLGAVLSTPQQASAVGWIAGLMLAGFGGCWWPSEVMPDWMRTASHVLPTAWAMDGFHAMISFGHGLQAVLLPSVVLLGFGGLFTFVGTLTLRYEA